MRGTRRSVACGLMLALTLTGCSSVVSVDPAPEANDPACAEISVRLPATLEGMDRVWTDAQATGAWGDPVAVILRCGMELPGASTLPCQSLGGVDWLIAEPTERVQTAVTFGTDPAVEVAMIRNAPFDYATVLDAVGRLVTAGQVASTGRTCS